MIRYLPDGTMIKFAPKSHSAEFVFKITSNKYLLFQLKNEKKPSYPLDVIQEYQKAIKIFKNFKTKVEAIFIYIPLRIDDSIQNQIKGGILLNELITTTTVVKFEYPVIILSRKQLIELIGNINFEILEKLKEDFEKDKTFLNAFNPFIRNLKRKHDEEKELKTQKK